MNLNPIKALSDLLGKLIIEHGSAVIQEKQISLFRDELSILSRKLAEFETENQNLKTENANLKKRIKEYNNSNHKRTAPKMEYVCPKCHEPAFKLIKNIPHPNNFFANSGATVRLHRCEKCNYEETR